MGPEDAFITIARVMKVQGRVGELLTELHTDFPERFAERRRLYAWNPETDDRRELLLQEFWPHKGGMVLKFEGIDSIEEAEKLLRREIQIPLAERAELDPDAVYVSDLLGCLVVETTGEEQQIGPVVDVSFAAGTQPLLIVQGDGGQEFMIPFVDGFIQKLDTQGKRIEMQLPEGLLELNPPSAAKKEPRKKR